MSTWGHPAGSPARTTPGREQAGRDHAVRDQAGQGGAGRGAELVLVGGKIRTPAHPSGFVQAAAISGGVVVALGRDEDIRDFVRPFTRVVNLRGRLAIPAFGDAARRAPGSSAAAGPCRPSPAAGRTPPTWTW
jgi:hypothetical protein